jgi:hypothetical protein
MKSSKAVFASIASVEILNATPAKAAGYFQSAPVVEIGVNRDYGNVAFIRLSVSPVDGAVCSVREASPGRWHWRLQRAWAD